MAAARDNSISRVMTCVFGLKLSAGLMLLHLMLHLGPLPYAAADLVDTSEDLIVQQQYQAAGSYLQALDEADLSAAEIKQRHQLLKYLNVIRFAETHLSDRYTFEKISLHFNSNEVPYREAEILARRYKGIYQKITARLQLIFNRPIHIYLYPENMELTLWTVLPSLSRYNLTRNEVHVHYGSLENHGHIEHEMVHIMTAHLNHFSGSGKIPDFLIEGLAEFIVGHPWGIDLDHWTRGFMALDRFIPVTDFLNDRRFRAYNPIIAYEESGSFVKYLIDRYGLDQFKLLYARPSFYNTYGKSLLQLNDEWMVKIRTEKIKALDLIGFRVKLGRLYQQPERLRRVPWMGVKTAVDQEKVYISRVSKNSPAARGKLKQGDEILKVNDTAINGKDVWKIYSTLLDKRPGDILFVSVKRNGQIINTQISLTSNPEWMVN